MPCLTHSAKGCIVNAHRSEKQYCFPTKVEHDLQREHNPE